MSDYLDIFEWLYEIERETPDGEVGPIGAFRRLSDAKGRNDSDGVRAARIELERIGDVRGLPWLGVFGRHWEFQHRVLGMGEGESAVADVVAGFEQSHRPENVDCPQSICTIQDLCLVYGKVDGPGYADETLAAAQDGLARIDSTWPCWECLQNEVVSSLEYDGQFLAAFDKLDEIEVEIRSRGGVPSLHNVSSQIDQLIDADRAEQARELAEATVIERYSQHDERALPNFRLKQARAQALTGQTEAALEAFAEAPHPLEFPEVAYSWRMLAAALIDQGALDNSDQVAAVMVRIAQDHRRKGSWRNAFRTGIMVGEFAAERGARASAKRAHGFCVEAMAKLHRPLGAPDKLAALEHAIASAPAQPTTEIETEVARLESDLADSFDAAKLSDLAVLLRFQGWDDDAQALLWDRVRAHPGDEESAMSLLSQLLGSNTLDRSECDELASLIQAEQPQNARWVRANAAARFDDWVECAERCAAMVDLDPELKNTRRLWLVALRELGDHRGLTHVRRELLALSEPLASPEPLPYDPDAPPEQHEAFERDRARRNDLWGAVVDASIAGEWDLVRSAGAELGMQLEGEGEIAEEWETIRVVFTDPDGVKRPATALRTGPATARVVQVAHPSNPQHHGDRVVFEPTPLNELPADATDADREWFLFEYPVVDVVESGDATAYFVEGAMPTDASQWELLRNGLHEAGFGVWRYGFDPEIFRPTGEQRDVLWISVAHIGELSASDLHEHLVAAFADWEHQPAWPVLAEAAGADHESHSRRLQNMWGIDEAD